MTRTGEMRKGRTRNRGASNPTPMFPRFLFERRVKEDEEETVRQGRLEARGHLRGERQRACLDYLRPVTQNMLTEIGSVVNQGFCYTLRLLVSYEKIQCGKDQHKMSQFSQLIIPFRFIYHTPRRFMVKYGHLLFIAVRISEYIYERSNW